MESPHFNTSSIRDKWHRWKSRPTSEGRYVSSIATIRTRWKVVVRLYGMLLLSAKCPRPLGRWWNAIQKTIWRTIQRTDHTSESNGGISSDIDTRSIKTSSIWQESITRNLSGLWADRGENLERRYLDSRPGRFGKNWTHQIFILEESKQRKYWSAKKWWVNIHNSWWYNKIVRKRLQGGNNL